MERRQRDAGTIVNVSGQTYAVTGSHDYTDSILLGSGQLMTVSIFDESGINGAVAFATSTFGVYDVLAVSDSTATPYETPVAMPVTGNDTVSPGDTISVSVTSAPAHGSVTVSGNTVTYTPASGFVGIDTFVYQDSDSTGHTSSATDTVTVEDVVSFSTATSSIYETGGTATITVDLVAAASSAVSVDYATSDDSAIAGTNYTAESGTLTFSAGESSATFTVPVLNNNGIGGYPAIVNL